MMLQSKVSPSSTAPKKESETQTVIGFPVSVLSFERQVSTIIGWAQAHLSKVVCVSNVHMLMEGVWNPRFSEILVDADMLTPDGMPLVWMTSIMNQQPQERVAGMELMMALCEQAQEKGLSVFFFGSDFQTLSTIRQKLFVDYPGLEVAGMHSPPFRNLSKEEGDAFVKEINNSGANLVFVSLGCPKQERWMYAHRDRISAAMVGLGGAFSVYTGHKRWAPAWIRKYGLEWLYRLFQEPKRLWKRYATTIPPFLWLALKQVIKVRLGLSLETSARKSFLKLPKFAAR